VTGFRISGPAEADLEDIARYTEQQWGRSQRDRYLLGMNDKFEALSQAPIIAAERTEFEPPVRIHHHEKHLIVYVIDDSGILIVRVLHENMDVPAHISS